MAASLSQDSIERAVLFLYYHEKYPMCDGPAIVRTVDKMMQLQGVSQVVHEYRDECVNLYMQRLMINNPHLTAEDAFTLAGSAVLVRIAAYTTNSTPEAVIAQAKASCAAAPE